MLIMSAGRGTRRQQIWQSAVIDLRLFPMGAMENFYLSQLEPSIGWRVFVL